MSFDLQVNPHQLKDAAAFIHDFPATPVIINHMGCPHPRADMAVWREGVQALARLPNTYMKLSMLPFAFGADWFRERAQCDAARAMARELIGVFGADRCMFGSNYPVDKHSGVPFGAMYACFWDWALESERPALLYETAARAYRIGTG